MHCKSALILHLGVWTLQAAGQHLYNTKTVNNASSPADQACAHLHATFPNATTFPTQTQYDEVLAGFWSASSASLQPACVFAPSCTDALASAVRTLVKFQSPFAMQGGGHMPIYDSNNINSTGVLLSSYNLKMLELSANRESLFVGPGNHWAAVYDLLAPHELLVAGGRLGVVGVPGLILGGGISYLSWEYGWSSATIKSMEVVLANGSVVTVTPANEYSDLMWALRGGGNSYGLVTLFEMTTYAAPSYAVGQVSYGTGPEIKAKWIEAIYNFAVHGADTDSASTVTPISNWGSIYEDITYTAMRFHNGNTTTPPALANFTSPNLPGVNDTFQIRTMSEWDAEIDPSFSQISGFRQRFHVVNTWPSLEAINIVHDTYYGLMNVTLFGNLGDVWIGGLTPMPISRQFFAASAVNGGDPMGIDPDDGPQIWYEINLSFADKQEYDDVATAFLQEFDRLLDVNLKAAGLARGTYLYLNDADRGQPVFDGYPAANVERLQEIRDKYDPTRVFTDLMPGGWKVADVDVDRCVAA